MAYTISTHNGSQVAREHNLRNRKVTDKEEHIDKEGIHEIWKDEKPKDAYKRIFGEAVERYNDRQIMSGHAERQINDYYKKICEDKKKHPVYEMIISIGNYEQHPSAELSRQILKEFVADWKRRNPNLIMIGAYYHEDEARGAASPYGHVHIDYIPVAYNLTRGIDTQNALNKALEQMGYETESMRDTAQMRWEKAENQYLENLCKEHGLQIEHPELEHKQHMNMTEYRQLKRIEELEKKNDDLQKVVNKLIDRHNEIIDTIDELETGSLEMAAEIIEQHETEKFEIFHELSR